MNEPGNPYEPPKADVNLGPMAGMAEELPTAGLGARLLNLIIDYVVFFIMSAIVAAIIQLLSPGEWGDTTSTLFGLVTMFGYYVLLEGAFGWTIGKLVTGTRVVAENDGKPTIGQVLGRTLARFIPFEAFSVLFGRSNQGWHDSLSGTRVVKVRR